MNKLSSTLVVGMLILAADGFAFAQDEPRVPQQDTQPEAQSDAGTDLAPLEPGDLVITEKRQEYLVALTECEPLCGNEKETCVEATRKKFGYE